jgi:hypothetical protein
MSAVLVCKSRQKGLYAIQSNHAPNHPEPNLKWCFVRNQDSISERQEILEKGNVGKDFTSCPRPLPQAIVSYLLANQRARIESESKTPYSIFKRAHYWTRIALLQRQAKMDRHRLFRTSSRALQRVLFSHGFSQCQCRIPSVFIIFTIYLRFGLMKEAREYVTVMEQSRKEVEERKDPHCGKRTQPVARYG